MRLTRVTLALGALGLAFAMSPRLASADVKDFKGQVPPELTTFEQVQGDPKLSTLKSLKNKVVMLEFFTTW